MSWRAYVPSAGAIGVGSLVGTRELVISGAEGTFWACGSGTFAETGAMSWETSSVATDLLMSGIATSTVSGTTASDRISSDCRLKTQGMLLLTRDSRNIHRLCLHSLRQCDLLYRERRRGHTRGLVKRRVFLFRFADRLSQSLSILLILDVVYSWRIVNERLNCFELKPES